MKLVSKYDGKCRKCKSRYKVGDTVEWIPGIKGVVCPICLGMKQAVQPTVKKPPEAIDPCAICKCETFFEDGASKCYLDDPTGITLCARCNELRWNRWCESHGYKDAKLPAQ